MLWQIGCCISGIAHTDPVLHRGWGDVSANLHAVCAQSVTWLWTEDVCVGEHSICGLASSLPGYEPAVTVRLPTLCDDMFKQCKAVVVDFSLIDQVAFWPWS